MATEQKYSFTCFMRCYEMCRQYFGHDYSLDSEGELELLKKSLKVGKRATEEYCISDLKNYFDVKVFLESPFNKYELYSEELENPIDPTYKILSIKDLIEAVESGVAFINIDSWHLNMIIHTGHWIFLKDYDNGKFIFDDPWEGEEMEISEDKLKGARKSLKERLNLVPALIKVQE